MKIDNNKEEHLTNDILSQDSINNILNKSIGNDDLDQK